MGRMLRARALKPGDTVAVAALSSGLEPDEAELFEQGVRAVEGLGFAVRVAPSVELGRHRWWMSAPRADIAAELNGLFRDPEVRAILALTGGRAALSYLDLIDFEAVRRDPKPLLGFSDIATLHLALHARTGLVTLHSDLVTHGFGYWAELADDRRREARGRLSTGAHGRPRTRAAPAARLVGVLAARARDRPAHRRPAQPHRPCAGGSVRGRGRALRRRAALLGGGRHLRLGRLERPARAA